MNEKMIVQCGVKIDNEYWFAAGNMNGLFKKNLLTDQIDFVGFFPQENKVGFRLYSCMRSVEDKIVFVPCHAKEITIYQIKENLFKKFPIIEKDKNCSNKYLRCVQYFENIYFIPFMAETFIKYNVGRNEINVLHEWEDICVFDENRKNFLIKEICIINNFIIMFVAKENRAIVLDMDTDQFFIQELEIPREENVCSVCNYDCNIWMITEKNNVYCWEFKTDSREANMEFKYHMNLRERFINSAYVYATSEHIYLINAYHKNIGKFNYKKNEFSMLDMEKYISDKNDDSWSLYYYYDCHILNDKIYLFSFYDGRYVVLDDNGVKEISSQVVFPKAYWEQDFSSETVHESTLIYLGVSPADYIKRIWDEDIKMEKKNQLQNVGEKIYEETKRV